MNELREILEALERFEGEGRSAVLATVVKTVGSSYRRPGARMLFPASGPPLGFVSGGCLEGDLAERAGEVSRSGEPRTVVYDMRSPDDIVWGLGLGCGGEVRVLLEPLEPGRRASYLSFLEGCLAERKRGVVATVFRGEGPAADSVGKRFTLDAAGSRGGDVADAELAAAIERDATTSLDRRRSAIRSYSEGGAEIEVLVEYVAPPVSLVIFGAGGDAVPLVRFAAELGWRVSVADHRPAYARPELFPDAADVRLVDYRRLERDAPAVDDHTAVVVMSHHFLNDLESMRFLLPLETAYLGFLGPRKRLENLLAEAGVDPDSVEARRLHGPAGIDIGSETPQEIALSILAEVRAVLGGRAGGFLRERRAPLHDGPE